MKSLASRLNNRIEIYGKQKVEQYGATTYKEGFIKKIWADIQPLSGKGRVTKEEADTESSTVRFKITIRKTQIDESNIIVFKGNKFEIDYIIPNFNNNSYLEVFANLKKE